MFDVDERLPVVRSLQFDGYRPPTVYQRSVRRRSNAHKRIEYDLIRITPQDQAALDHVQLEGVHMALIGFVAGLSVRQHAIKAHIVPERRGVLAPDPMRIAILELTPIPAPIGKHIGWWLTFSGVIGQP